MVLRWNIRLTFPVRNLACLAGNRPPQLSSPYYTIRLHSPHSDAPDHILRYLTTPNMQRPTYNPPPAHSPPLHHPVPQHVSTVPMMRSPPPPQSQGSNYGGSPYGGQQPVNGGAGQQFAPGFNFGGVMNDQTAQMGFQIGQQAVMKGGEYMEASVRPRSHISSSPPLHEAHSPPKL